MALTKAQLLLDLLSREQGATLSQMVAATGWLPHTVRAALTGIRKKGHPLFSARIAGERVYRITDASA